MPRDKDVKRLVCALMEKAGESYSIARLQVAREDRVARTAAPASKRVGRSVLPSRIYQVKITIDEIGERGYATELP